MAENKKSFLLYVDLIHTVNQLPDDKAGQLFKHILLYVNDKNPITDDLITKISFEPIKQQLKRDLNKYENICDRNSNNGKLGGRPKNPNKPKKPIGLFGNPNKPRKADSDSESENESENDILLREKKDFYNFSNELFNDPQWNESIRRLNKINSDELLKYLDKFDLKMKNELDNKTNKKEYAGHFSRWLSIEKEKSILKNGKEKLTGAQAFLKQFE
jgi:hypothetical protein